MLKAFVGIMVSRYKLLAFVLNLFFFPSLFLFLSGTTLDWQRNKFIVLLLSVKKCKAKHNFSIFIRDLLVYNKKYSVQNVYVYIKS